MTFVKQTFVAYLPMKPIVGDFVSLFDLWTSIKNK